MPTTSSQYRTDAGQPALTCLFYRDPRNEIRCANPIRPTVPVELPKFSIGSVRLD